MRRQAKEKLKPNSTPLTHSNYASVSFQRGNFYGAFLFARRRGLLFWLFCSICVATFTLLPYRQVVEVQIKSGQILGQTVSTLPIVPDFRPVLKTDARIFETRAKIAYALDLQTGTLLYEKASNISWPAASLAKLMTALVTVNTVTLDSVITVNERVLSAPQPVVGLVAGERITVRDLLAGMLIPSANDAAYALALGVASSTPRFVELMNSMGEKLGLSGTHFRNPTGFDDLAGFTTAQDLSRLTMEFLRNPVLARIVQTQTASVASVDNAIRHWLKTSNKLLAEKGILGVKTGYTQRALGNLIILAEDEKQHQILTVVLGSDQRERDSQELIDWIFSAYRFAD